MEHQNLWAPWRMAYIRQLVSPAPGQPAVSEAPGSVVTPAAAPPGPIKPSACFLCDAAALPIGSEGAKQRFVLVNDSRGMILLNLYPYTNGHLLVAGGDHLGDLLDLSPAQRAGLMELTALAEELLRAALNPQGINIGINLGRCAGAGLPGHMHIHVVPRWAGDVNFMETVGHVRVIPQALEESYAYLAEVLSKMGTAGGKGSHG